MGDDPSSPNALDDSKVTPNKQAINVLRIITVLLTACLICGGGICFAEPYVCSRAEAVASSSQRLLSAWLAWPFVQVQWMSWPCVASSSAIHKS